MTAIYLPELGSLPPRVGILVAAGLQEVMPPRRLTDDRWMARAVPDMTKARTESGPGPAVS